MSYKDLYTFCQGQDLHIGRNTIKKKMLALTGIKRLPTVRTTLDTSICRGFYLSARNKEHPLVEQLGCNIIVLARDQNRCWERFIFVKEMMHLFDEPAQSTTSEKAFERLLLELSGSQSPELSPQAISEASCAWMALGALCPEEQRQQFSKERAAGQTDDYAIALRLRIPEMYVPVLFGDQYEEIIQSLLQ